MTDNDLFPVTFPREADDWLREAGGKAAQVVCYVEGCGGLSFDLIAVSGERNYRVVCAVCEMVQTELTVLHLGSISGVS